MKYTRISQNCKSQRSSSSINIHIAQSTPFQREVGESLPVSEP